jgi:predicted phosphoribosyltransferase
LAIPKGGTAVGYVISQELALPLEIAVTKKIEHPYLPGETIGTVSLNSRILKNKRSFVSEDYIERETKRLKQVIKDRIKLYLGSRAPLSLAGKNILITDEGATTGTTIRAVIDTLRNEHPKAIYVAVPVASAKVIKELDLFVNEVFCLCTPNKVNRLGEFYKNYRKVKDSEVINLLETAYNEEPKMHFVYQ